MSEGPGDPPSLQTVLKIILSPTAEHTKTQDNNRRNRIVVRKVELYSNGIIIFFINIFNLF